jgi:molybdopterin/thiamine biosynthesis adenylyltransferase
MIYSLTFTQRDYEYLTAHLLTNRSTEKAAYLLCGFSVTGEETRLLVQEVIPVEESDIEESSSVHMKIKSSSYVRALKKASDTKRAIIFIHSHPLGAVSHSVQDDKEEIELSRVAYLRVGGVPIHGSLVFSDYDKPRGRVWHKEGGVSPMYVVRVIGKRFSFYYSEDIEVSSEYFDRHIRALSESVQKVLQRLKIGIVGLGGTGSAVVEQLVRLGVGTVLIFDPDKFELTNINRIYGSRAQDAGLKKVDITERHINEIGLPVRVRKFDSSISNELTAKELRNCDLVFGCTDDHYGRMIISKLSTYYHIPVLDVGVSVDSSESIISAIQGRISVVSPDDPCLVCSSVINPDLVRSEIEEKINPEEANKKRKEGYLVELPGTAPSVIPFTSIVSSGAIIELLHRIAGILKEPRSGSLLVHRFDHSEVRTLSKKKMESCSCNDKAIQGKGDTDLFLGMTW